MERLSWILLMGGLVAYIRGYDTTGEVVPTPSAQREVDPTRWRGSESENEWVRGYERLS